MIPGREYNTLRINVFNKTNEVWNVQLFKIFRYLEIKRISLLLSFNLRNPDDSIIVAFRNNGYNSRKYVWIDIPISDITRNIKIAFDGNLAGVALECNIEE